MSVRVEDLTRSVTGSKGEKTLLQDVSLDVPNGEFVALVGPSGAGKTTLLRAIAGLDPATSGQIMIDGRAMQGLAPRERNVGFVFQNYALFQHLTVAKNISFGLDVLPRAQRPSRTEIAQKVSDLLQLIRLPDLGSAYPYRLSGGQRQRVALARALARRPGLLLLDEPFGALDPVVRRAVRTWIRSLHEQLGLTTILVTHDQEEALDVADRVVVMQDGRIMQDGNADTLEIRPATPFVMEFLGESLCFAGQISRGWFLADEAHIEPFQVADQEAGPAVAMIRPYEVTLVPEAEGSSLKRTGGRYGMARLLVDLGARSVEILRPEAEMTAVDGTKVNLAISSARLFRDGHLLHGKDPVVSAVTAENIRASEIPAHVLSAN